MFSKLFRNCFTFACFVSVLLSLSLSSLVAAEKDSKNDGLSEPVSLRPYAPGTPQFGKGGTPKSPKFAVLRHDEDWSWLVNTNSEDGATFPMKVLSLGKSSEAYATIAVDTRVAVEYFDNENYGVNAGPDTSLHLLGNVHVGLSLSERFRVYGAIKYGEVSDKSFQVPVAEDDGPDLHQAFAELAIGDVLSLNQHDFIIRAGRQELHYGAGRLISIRGGPNVSFDFDGLLARARLGNRVTDIFAFRPTENDLGRFDNSSDSSQGLWGAYSSVSLSNPGGSLLNHGHIDAFYIGHQREVSPYAFQSSPIDEVRHTLGARFWTSRPPPEGLNIDIETGVQFGEAKGLIVNDSSVEGDILAGFIAGSLSYGLSGFEAIARYTPVASLRFGYSSGDDDSTDKKIGTFRAPFPPGRFFGDVNPIGPGNLIGGGPALSLSPSENLTLTGRAQGFWRASSEDGIYAPPQVPVRGNAGDSKFIALETSLLVNWQINKFVRIHATVSYASAQSFLEDNLPSKDATYGELHLFYRL